MDSLTGVVDGIVDAHLHQWNPRHTPWAASRLTRAYRFMPAIGDRLFPVVANAADREYVLTPSTVARAYEPAQYSQDAARVPTVAGVPVDTVVHIESHWRSSSSDDDASVREAHTGFEATSIDETRYVLSLPFGVRHVPRLGAIVVNGDPRSESLGAGLDAQVELTDRVRAVRWGVARHPDPKVRDFGDSDGIMASSAFLRGFEQLADRRLGFEAFCYSHQLYEVATLAREYPDTTIVLDHLGAPVGAFGPVGARTGATAAARADILRLWRERVVTLSACPNVVVKLSGLALPILGYGRARSGNIGSRATLAEMIGPLVTHIVDHFGSDRVLWGSNFPIDSPNASLDMEIGALIDVLGERGEHLLRSLFRDTAARVYRLDR